MNIKNYNRIMIVGSPGSGKSTFAEQLCKITSLPLIHLDNEFWKPGWVETPRPEWIGKQKLLVSGDKWIIDGDYSSTMEIRFEAAELIIFLDVNRFICIMRAAKRTGKKRMDLPDYLDEPKAISNDFFEFCKWIWDYPKKGRKKVLLLHNEYSEKAFLHIKYKRDVKKILRGET